jgi:hypothetical protein
LNEKRIRSVSSDSCDEQLELFVPLTAIAEHDWKFTLCRGEPQRLSEQWLTRYPRSHITLH